MALLKIVSTKNGKFYATIFFTNYFAITKRYLYQLDQLQNWKGLRDTRENDRDYRIIFVNNARPSSYNGELPLKYADNEIKTSKVKFKKSSFGNLLPFYFNIFSNKISTQFSRLFRLICTNNSDA